MAPKTSAKKTENPTRRRLQKKIEARESAATVDAPAAKKRMQSETADEAPQTPPAEVEAKPNAKKMKRKNNSSASTAAPSDPNATPLALPESPISGIDPASSGWSTADTMATLRQEAWQHDAQPRDGEELPDTAPMSISKDSELLDEINAEMAEVPREAAEAEGPMAESREAAEAEGAESKGGAEAMPMDLDGDAEDEYAPEAASSGDAAAALSVREGRPPTLEEGLAAEIDKWQGATSTASPGESLFAEAFDQLRLSGPKFDAIATLENHNKAVSYTHLTLPTKRIV